MQYTTNAGGKKPEIRLYWSPAFTGLTLFKSPVVNTVGRTELLLEFKHYLDHYDTPYTLGVKLPPMVLPGTLSGGEFLLRPILLRRQKRLLSTIVMLVRLRFSLPSSSMVIFTTLTTGT